MKIHVISLFIVGVRGSVFQQSAGCPVRIELLFPFFFIRRKVLDSQFAQAVVVFFVFRSFSFIALVHPYCFLAG